MTKLIREIDKQFVLKASKSFSWDNIGRVEDIDGTQYKLIKVDDNHVRSIGDGHDRIYEFQDIFPLVNIYDKQGNLVNNMEDYD